jgi:hypothetical protein
MHESVGDISSNRYRSSSCVNQGYPEVRIFEIGYQNLFDLFLVERTDLFL